MGAFLSALAKPVALLVGTAYPAYASFKAIEFQLPEETSTWLMYWVVWSAFAIMECFADWILAWLPLYYVIKLCFVLYLQLPQTQGARLMYVQLVMPLLKRHQERIDSVFEEGKRRLGDYGLLSPNPQFDFPASGASTIPPTTTSLSSAGVLHRGNPTRAADFYSPPGSMRNDLEDPSNASKVN